MSAVRKRRAALIGELARLSRDGWQHARPCDYRPLEKALAKLNAKAGGK